jgi:hypothetical protein
MDILDSIAIMIPCRTCGGSYEVTLKQVALSQKMIHVGCPVHAQTECPPLYYAPLIDRQLAQDLQKLWARLEREAHAAGAELKLYGTS